MNSLQLFLVREGIPETNAMNTLQENGIISDNCVTVENVSERDCLRAVEFLEGRAVEFLESK